MNAFESLIQHVDHELAYYNCLRQHPAGSILTVEKNCLNGHVSITSSSTWHIWISLGSNGKTVNVKRQLIEALMKHGIDPIKPTKFEATLIVPTYLANYSVVGHSKHVLGYRMAPEYLKLDCKPDAAWPFQLSIYDMVQRPISVMRFEVEDMTDIDDIASWEDPDA